MDMEAAVLNFQKHVGAPAPAWPNVSEPDAVLIDQSAMILENLSKIFKDKFKRSQNQAFLRIELILEEVSEILVAIADNDQIAALDGVVDSAYVIIGTATAFDLPFNAAFEEVHKSNMTKTSEAAKHAGAKGKGPDYVAPDIAAILYKHRKQK